MKPSDSMNSMYLLFWELIVASFCFIFSVLVPCVVVQVRLTPTLEVYAQLSKPDGVREGSMPCTAWKCTTQSHSLPANTGKD